MKFNVGVDLIYNGFYSTELDYSLTFCLFYLVGKEEPLFFLLIPYKQYFNFRAEWRKKFYLF